MPKRLWTGTGSSEGAVCLSVRLRALLLVTLPSASCSVDTTHWFVSPRTGRREWAPQDAASGLQLSPPGEEGGRHLLSFTELAQPLAFLSRMASPLPCSPKLEVRASRPCALLAPTSHLALEFFSPWPCCRVTKRYTNPSSFQGWILTPLGSMGTAEEQTRAQLSWMTADPLTGTLKAGTRRRGPPGLAPSPTQASPRG